MWWGKIDIDNDEPEVLPVSQARRAWPQVNATGGNGGAVRCCGCEQHAMEQRPTPEGGAWWCYTCNAWQTGCGR